MIQHNDIEGNGNGAICHIIDIMDTFLAPVESGGSGTSSALRKSYQIVVEIQSHDTAAWRWLRSDLSVAFSFLRELRDCIDLECLL